MSGPPVTCAVIVTLPAVEDAVASNWIVALIPWITTAPRIAGQLIVTGLSSANAAGATAKAAARTAKTTIALRASLIMTYLPAGPLADRPRRRPCAAAMPTVLSSLVHLSHVERGRPPLPPQLTHVLERENVGSQNHVAAGETPSLTSHCM